MNKALYNYFATEEALTLNADDVLSTAYWKQRATEALSFENVVDFQ